SIPLHVYIEFLVIFSLKGTTDGSTPRYVRFAVRRNFLLANRFAKFRPLRELELAFSVPDGAHVRSRFDTLEY
ncbi:MAG: hypothetical protein IJB49_00440, partial [Clostridia bacterium]|nr:hypothetical protein [Clostridia bacterium]